MTLPNDPSPSLDARKYSLCWIVASIVASAAAAVARAVFKRQKGIFSERAWLFLADNVGAF
eukprot:scaffold19009_cov55-Phaeocystis_antarctica.AAC.3